MTRDQATAAEEAIRATNNQVTQLLTLRDADDPYDYLVEDVFEAQLFAVRERFMSASRGMPVLDRLLHATGFNRLDSRESLIRLLFPHTVYKTYSEDGPPGLRWTRMARWLDALSSAVVDSPADAESIFSLSEWMELMHSQGHFVFTSSGTTGKASVLNQNSADRDLVRDLGVGTMAWSAGLSRDQLRPVFVLSSTSIGHRQLEVYRATSEYYSTPELTFWLTDEPLSFRELFILSDPGSTDSRAPRVRRAYDTLVDKLIEVRDGPIIVLGFGPLHWRLARRLTARGVTGLHPDSAIQAGTQTKGLQIPANFHDELAATFGVPANRFLSSYGMVETASTFPRCGAGSYHVPPWVMPLVLTPDGCQLTPLKDSTTDGRLALFDFAVSGRWCGLTTGDQVRLRIDRCRCGRRGMWVASASRMFDAGPEPPLPALDRVSALLAADAVPS
jgi:hypothetical protein